MKKKFNFSVAVLIFFSFIFFVGYTFADTQRHYSCDADQCKADPSGNYDEPTCGGSCVPLGTKQPSGGSSGSSTTATGGSGTQRIYNLPNIPGNGGAGDIQSLTDLIGYIYNLAFWIVGVAVFINILWGGFIVFFGAAGSSSKLSQGISKIWNSILGFILLVAAYLILYTINPNLVKNTFDFGTLVGGGTNPIATVSNSPNTSGITNPTPTATQPSPSTDIVGVSDYNGPETWPDADWSNTKPELRSALNAFNQAWVAKGNGSLRVRQVFRPDYYAKYIRSLWEYDQILKGKNPLADLYGCDGFRHITPEDVKNLTAEQLTLVKQKIAIHNNIKGPACTSDHGQGIAFDITPPAGSKIADWVGTAISLGLCHHISGDLPHFALKQYLPGGTNCLVLN